MIFFIKNDAKVKYFDAKIDKNDAKVKTF